MSGKNEKVKRQLQRIEEALKNTNSPWYERNTFWGPIAIGVGLVATVIFYLYPRTATAILLLVAFLCFSFPVVVTAVRSPWSRRKKIAVSAIGGALSFSVLLPIWLIRTVPLSKETDERKQAEAPKEATAIFMETRLTSLPLTISPGSRAHVVSLNRARITSEHSFNWGFYDVPNDGAVPSEWPNKTVMKRAAQAKNPAVFAWKAEVSNHGPSTVLDLSIPIKLWFGNNNKEVIYNAIVTPLESRQSFTFYLVNDCPLGVAAAWPDTAKLQVIGENARRDVPLRRTFTSPIDQLMFFFGSSTRLVGDYPCE